MDVSVKKAGLSTVSVEVPRESVETMWNVASSKVKGEGGELQVKEAFLSMIDTVVNSGTSLELKVSGQPHQKAGHSL